MAESTVNKVMGLIMVHRARWNDYSNQNDIVGILDDETTESNLAIVAETHPENIYYFAEVVV